MRTLICYHQLNEQNKNVYNLNIQEKKLDSMEDELKDVEEMRLTVLNMMTKRKKGANKENVS